jgi:hypothetical protein
MADITTKAVLAAVTPKGTDKHGGSADGGHSGLGGFSSLPSSIHHGLSERLQGFTEKLQSLGQRSNNEPSGGDGQSNAASRSRTSSWGTSANPSLAVQRKSEAPPEQAAPQSPSRTCSRTSSKKSNQSTLISNGKMTDGE